MRRKLRSTGSGQGARQLSRFLDWSLNEILITMIAILNGVLLSAVVLRASPVLPRPGWRKGATNQS